MTEDHDNQSKGVLTAFARAMPELGIAPETIALGNEAKGEPDIVCKIGEQSHFFELARVVHEDVGSESDPFEPYRRAVLAKAGKYYDVGEHPLELLVWTDTSRDALEGSVAERAVPALTAEIAKHQGCWNRVWLFLIRGDGLKVWPIPQGRNPLPRLLQNDRT